MSNKDGSWKANLLCVYMLFRKRKGAWVYRCSTVLKVKQVTSPVYSMDIRGPSGIPDVLPGFWPMLLLELYVFPLGRTGAAVFEENFVKGTATQR